MNYSYKLNKYVQVTYGSPTLGIKKNKFFSHCITFAPLLKISSP